MHQMTVESRFCLPLETVQNQSSVTIRQLVISLTSARAQGRTSWGMGVTHPPNDEKSVTFRENFWLLVYCCDFIQRTG